MSQPNREEVEGDNRFSMILQKCQPRPHYSFYEKVVKVKADVAAILNFFSRSIPHIEADPFGTRPGDPIGGMRKGGFSGAIMAAGPQRGMKIAVVWDSLLTARQAFEVEAHWAMSPKRSITRTPSGTTNCRLPLG